MVPNISVALTLAGIAVVLVLPAVVVKNPSKPLERVLYGAALTSLALMLAATAAVNLPQLVKVCSDMKVC